MASSPLLGRIRNRAWRVRQHRWRMAPYRSEERHIVMGGAPRSGTTLLRRLLDRHPEICAGAETKLFVPAAFNLAWLAESYAIPLDELEAMRGAASSQAGFIDAFAVRARADTGKSRWAEKTPQNIRHLDWILEHFPGASVIHVIRDGRDVVCSMREHPDWRWVDGAWQKVLVPRPLHWYAERWVEDTAAGMARRGDGRYVEVRYEDLVSDPVMAMRAVCERLDVTLDAAWLAEVGARGHDGWTEMAGHEAAGRSAARPDYEGAVTAASVGRWQRDLSAEAQRDVERLCGARLRQLGYLP
jgi:protein-tyrosine sulfotransferase